MDATWVSPSVTTSRSTALVAFTLEVPSSVGYLHLQQALFPLRGGRFPGT